MHCIHQSYPCVLSTYRKDNYHAKCVHRRVLSILYTIISESFRQTTTWNAAVSHVEHKGSCLSRYVDKQVQWSLYISCHELDQHDSISFQDFFLFVVSRRSYRSTWNGQQVRWSEHICNHALGLHYSSGNHMAILGIDVELGKNKQSFNFEWETHDV